MDIRTSLDGLKSLLGVTPPETAAAQQKSTPATVGSGLTSDRATFSSAGSEVSLTAAEPGVRTDKVANVQAAIAAGTYNVPASAVASKVVGSMLGEES
ncbi:MAG: flagellar biosynthesis anti-sigma factor FlgM [Terracidiphilus sp.]|jgi:negative regulator of flagellin synthesis FlgM